MRLAVAKKITSIFFKGHERTTKAKINILGMFLLKGLSILLSLVIVPLTIDYISPYQYGIWITLSSIIGWLSFFDIGFGNGLKNKFVEAVTNGDKTLARIYVSTTYAILFLIISLVWCAAMISSFYVNWSGFLNAPQSLASELRSVVFIVLTTFACQFIFGLINTVLNALQKPVLPALYNTISQLLILVGILIVSRNGQGSLVNLSLIVGGANSAVLVLFSFWLFTHELKDYAPNLKHIKFKYSGQLMNLGLKFFLLQVIALVYYETNNIIITKVLSPDSVTIYNIAFKYMSVVGMIFSIIITPFWAAFTEANAMGDYSWMIKMASKLRLICGGVAIIAILMAAASPYVYKVWLGSKVHVPVLLTLLMAIWQIVNLWNSLHSTLLYGIGKVKLQLIGSLFVGVLNLPVTIYLCHKFQLNGIVISQVILSFSISWIGVVQLNKLLYGKAKGMWNA